MDLVPVGFTNFVAAGRIVAIANPGSAPIKRLVRQAEEKGLVVDLTGGRKVKTVLVLDSGHIALVARQPETIAVRANSAGARPFAGPVLERLADTQEEERA